jgi:hypothetical protein
VTAPRILFFVSSHGFGHATRCAAVLAALARAGVPADRLQVRSEAPGWIFTRRVPGIACTATPIDPGLLQQSGLDLDLPGTLAAHSAFVDGWEAHVDRESDAIADFGASLVVGDIPPLAFAAAARAGVSAIGVANFSWDWILDEYEAAEPRWSPILALYRSCYARARRLFRLPLHGDLSVFSEITDTPLLVNRATGSREECRASLGLAPDDRRRLVLVSFGGFGGGPMQASSDEDLSAYLFVGIGDAPDGFRGEWIALPRPATGPHEDLVCAADALLGKPGYSSVAEALAHGTRFLYVTRPDFREVEVLESGLARQGCARAIPRADFERGHWRAHLDALFELPEAPPPPRNDGAEVIATTLLSGG